MFVCLFKGSVVVLHIALRFETVFAVFPRPWALHSLHYPKMYRGVPVKPNPVKDLNRIDLPLVSDPRPYGEASQTED